MNIFVFIIFSIFLISSCSDKYEYGNIYIETSDNIKILEKIITYSDVALQDSCYIVIKSKCEWNEFINNKESSYKIDILQTYDSLNRIDLFQIKNDNEEYVKTVFIDKFGNIIWNIYIDKNGITGNFISYKYLDTNVIASKFYDINFQEGEKFLLFTQYNKYSHNKKIEENFIYNENSLGKRLSPFRPDMHIFTYSKLGNKKITNKYGIIKSNKRNLKQGELMESIQSKVDSSENNFVVVYKIIFEEVENEYKRIIFIDLDKEANKKFYPHKLDRIKYGINDTTYEYKIHYVY